MKATHPLTAATLIALCGTNAHAATVTWDGAATTDVDNWTTSSVAFDDTVQSGHSMNWENVVTNTVVVDSVGNDFDSTWQANTNYTIGHLYMYNQSFDLALTTGGIETLDMTADFNATAFANWSPVVSITSGGSTTYYRWNHAGNNWNGNGALDFSLGSFDLSDGPLIWGELNDTATGFGGTRDNGTAPNLQATSGVFAVGFLQWGASTGGNVALQTFSTAIDAWDTELTYTPVPEPASALLLGLGSLAIASRRRN